MPSQTQKSESSASSASSVRTRAPEQLVALPSLSCSLHSLPQAKSVDSVALHPNSMSSQRQAESEAKLRKALSKSSAGNTSSLPPAYVPHQLPQYSPSSNEPPLMMRKPVCLTLFSPHARPHLLADQKDLRLNRRSPRATHPHRPFVPIGTLRYQRTVRHKSFPHAHLYLALHH
ncbi:hypothetical protein OBBRIDRAFT_735157 [Obba rivulosa]|uniref:Uncharacterized protein n=1 Tax=Obba rivulosa TaxID=1052685 RepID=A0A8E2DID2_9APHY|nr:hypothetical protein OBBRIDRAFT_735157 [Obba rivulosa]